MELQEQIIGIINATMAKKGITNYRMCKDLGVDASATLYILKGKRNVTFPTLDRMLKYLDIKLEVVEG